MAGEAMARLTGLEEYQRGWRDARHSSERDITSAGERRLLDRHFQQ